MSKAELAEGLGVTEDMITQFESGKLEVPNNLMRKMDSLVKKSTLGETSAWETALMPKD